LIEDYLLNSMSSGNLMSSSSANEESKRDSFSKDAIKKSVGGVSMERIDLPAASNELRRYGRELADKVCELLML
jgi:hypothetical protein